MRFIYRAVKSRRWGITASGSLVAGVTLVPANENEWDHDPLKEELDNAEAYADITLPPGGLVEGQLYELAVSSTDSDWETGIVDTVRLALVPAGEATK